jgi:hypothetical protein
VARVVTGSKGLLLSLPDHPAAGGAPIRAPAGHVLFGCVRVEEAGEELGELPEVVGGQDADRRGRAQRNRVGGRDGLVPGRREGDQFTAPVIGVGAALDQAVSFQLVDDQGRAGGVDAVGRRELAEGRRSVAELEEDFAAAAAKAESECFGELAVAVVRREARCGLGGSR